VRARVWAGPGGPVLVFISVRLRSLVSWYRGREFGNGGVVGVAVRLRVFSSRYQGCEFGNGHRIGGVKGLRVEVGAGGR